MVIVDITEPSRRSIKYLTNNNRIKHYARWAGVWSSSLTTWPNSEFRLLAMTSRTEGRLLRSTTSVFLTKSCQRIPRIIRWQRMWKASSFRRSSCRSVHVSEPYNKMDSIQVWYRRSFVCSWSRGCRQTLFIECMAVEAMPMRLIMSGWHLPEVDWTAEPLVCQAVAKQYRQQRSLMKQRYSA